jgi:hypothetical protein
MQTHFCDNERAVKAAARQMLGCYDVAVTPYITSIFGGGGWLGLSVKWTADGEWEALGRRRSHEELFGLIRSTAAKRGSLERN